MVLSFHFFARWTPPVYSQNIYPYKLEMARQVSQFGYMGAQLFFMVSGFVILRSLEHQRNFVTFASARIRRIFPSLCIAIPIIYIFCNLLNQEFIAPIPISSMLPSLLLLGPDFLNQLFSTQLIWTTSVLWSLFIEIQFYLVAGLLFFRLKQYNFITKLFVFAISVQSLKIFFVLTKTETKTLDALLPLSNHIWWFFAGAICYKMLNSKKNRYLQSLSIVSILFNLILLNYESSKYNFNPIPSMMTIIFYLTFYLVTKMPKKMSFLRSIGLVWLGGISYEIYLIHESIGISVISKINQLAVFPNILPLQVLLLTCVIINLIALSVLLKKISHNSLIMLQMFVTTRG
jgi:peptidoglycan/LPS O-acetylase OafA/YrhL